MPEDPSNSNKIPVNGVETDSSITKIIILGVLNVGLASVFGYFLKLITDGQGRLILGTLLLGIGFLIFFLLDVFLIKSFWRITVIVVLESLALLIFFLGSLSFYLFSGFLIIVLLLLSSIQAGRRELANMLKIRFWRISKVVVPKAIFALALFSGLVYFNSVKGEESFFISPPVFERIFILSSGGNIIEKFFPGFSMSTPLGESLRAVAQRQVNDEPQFQSLPEESREELISQTTRQLEEKFSSFLGVSLGDDASLPGVIYRAIVQWFASLPETGKMLASGGAAFLIFLTIIALTWPIRLLVSVLSYLVYEIFLALGFSVIMLESRSREIILLK